MGRPRASSGKPIVDWCMFFAEGCQRGSSCTLTLRAGGRRPESIFPQRPANDDPKSIPVDESSEWQAYHYGKKQRWWAKGEWAGGWNRARSEG